MVRHPQTGKYRRTRLFVLTLGYSRKAVRLLVWQSSTQVWAELHERAFRRLLRRYLERRPPVPLSLKQVDPLIRQLTLYRHLIDRTGDTQ
jgi:hypothetical protein